jgi:hypothetical protein
VSSGMRFLGIIVSIGENGARDMFFTLGLEHP